MILPISQTATFNDLFNKLNEVIVALNTLDGVIGDLNDLTTLSKDTLVEAINERNGDSNLLMNLMLED